MLHVILLIFKILGIIFLVAVGLLLLFLYEVFFSAIPYRIEADKKENIRIAVFASWFFRIVTVRFRLDSENGWEPVFRMRFFGYPLWRNVEEGSRWKRLKKFRKWMKKKFLSRWRRGRAEAKPDPEMPVGEEPVRNMGQPAKRPDEKAAGAMPECRRPDPEKDDISASGQKKETSPADHAEGRRNSKKKTVFQKAVYAFRSVCDKIKQIWKKIRELGNAVRKIWKRKDMLLEFWNLEEHRHAREAVMGEVRYLWRKLRPRNVRGRITFGFADPAYTGICMGVAGMLCAWYPKKLEIVPDFDREILEGGIRMKGKARFYVIVRALWSIYRNEDIRHMYRHWQEL